MATTGPLTETPQATEGDQCVVMHGVDWRGYLSVLRARGERKVPRIVYLDGDLYLMSPAFPHEHLAERLGMFIVEVIVGLDIPCVPAGSTTFRRRRKRGGVEGDKTFYLVNAGRIIGKGDLDLREDPPPDLVIEAVNTHEADAAIEVWRRFGVPEVWVCDASGLRILVRQANGRYAERSSGAAFPFLTGAEVFEWVARPQSGNETTWVKDVRRWVRDVLAQRARGEGGRA